MKNLIYEASPVMILAACFVVYVGFMRMIIGIGLMPETVNGIIQ